MRDLLSTPIIRYDGPPELRKILEMESRKYLGYLQAIHGDLPYGKFSKQLQDGTIIEVQSINHTGKTDVVKIIVPPQVVEELKKKRLLVPRKRVIPKIEKVEQIIPVLVEFPDTTTSSSHLSLCSWASPSFDKFNLFFKEPPQRPMYALIQPEPREITLREFKSYDNGSGGVSTTDTPGDLVVDGEGTEGDPQQGSSGGTETIVYKIVTPDGDVLKEVVYNVDNDVSWSQWIGPTENPGLWALFTNVSDHVADASGDVLISLGYSYIPDTGDFACIYVQSARIGHFEDTAYETENPYYVGVDPTPELNDPSVFMTYDFGANINCTYEETNTLRLLSRKGGTISDIALSPTWDYESEWEVSDGNVTIYKEGVVVYSYLKTEKGIAE